MSLIDLRRKLQTLASAEKAKTSSWFFKTGPGQYGEGDHFIGVTVPEQRALAAEYNDLPLEEIAELLHSPVHEERSIALFILTGQFRKGEAKTKKAIVSFYYKNRQFINNWDLVDSSAPHILGNYLLNHSRAILYRLAKSKSIWDRRIAVVATLEFLAHGKEDDTIKICELLLNDSEDLIHKAIGWVLREMGKRVSYEELVNFLKKNYSKMPRTSLRYAIEHFPAETRAKYLKGEF